MTPTILLSGTIGVETTARFALPDGDRPCTLYAKGLGVGESVTLEILDSTGTGVAWKYSGADRALDPDNNVRSVIGPGEFQVRCAASAGAIEVGLYGAR